MIRAEILTEAEIGRAFASYLRELIAFTVDNEIPRDLPSRVRKAGEEFGELAEAVANSLGRFSPNVENEAADLINVGLDVILLGLPEGTPFAEVLRILTDNLRTKAAKYRAGKQRTEERR